MYIQSDQTSFSSKVALQQWPSLRDGILSRPLCVSLVIAKQRLGRILFVVPVLKSSADSKIQQPETFLCELSRGKTSSV
jgi:hypothetical protein